MVRLTPGRTDGNEQLINDNGNDEPNTCRSYEVIQKSLRISCNCTNVSTENLEKDKSMTDRLQDLVNGCIPTINQRGIKFCHLNIHSLEYKIDELNILLRNELFDIICLNETLCDSSIPDSELNIDDFVLFRKDRNRRGGGVAMYISNKYDLNCNDLECLWLELCHPHKPPILVGSIHRPPNSTSGYFEKLDICLANSMSENISCAIF